jgi:hypothetical protein
MGDNFYIGGYDVSGDTSTLSRIGGGPAPWDVTGINSSAFERIGLLRDGAMEWVSFFNDAALAAHPALSSLPTTDRIATYFRGTTLGNSAASEVCKQVNYDPNRGADGSLTIGVQALSNGYGLEWGVQLTAGKRTDTGATSGTGVDLSTGSLSFGAQFYLQVFSFAGTDVTVKIQESSDNGAGDAWADVTGGGFTAITSAPGAQRIATATNLTVERYLRVTTTTSGGFTSLVFAVQAVRNLATPAF